jgi:hypothetical protein
MVDNTFSSQTRSIDAVNNPYNTYAHQRNSQINMLENTDTDKYMSIVETELKALGYTLDNRAFIANIITILDKLIEPRKFNKTIFFHILDYANLNHDSLILLLDFFRSFFNVYESMKKNKSEVVLEINKNLEELNEYRKKLITIQREETILENGLTNNSVLKITALNINIDYQSARSSGTSIAENSLKLKFIFGNFTQEIDSSALNRKISFNVNSLSQLEDLLRIFLIVKDKEIFVEKISLRDILDIPANRQFTYENVNFELNMIWINSKINFYNKEIARLETQIADSKESVDVLNNSITYIEGIMS